MKKNGSLVLNIHSGSGCGKSTIAAGVYTELKLRHGNAELVREYIKKWAWKKTPPGKFDQIYVLGQQINAESILYGQVEIIITDSPILLVSFYEQYLLGEGFLKNTTLDFMKYAESHGVTYLNFWLERPETFDTRGRYETKETAMKIDVLMKDWLIKEAGIKLINLPADHNERVRLILEEVAKYKTINPKV